MDITYLPTLQNVQQSFEIYVGEENVRKAYCNAPVITWHVTCVFYIFNSERKSKKKMHVFQLEPSTTSVMQVKYSC